MAEARTHASGLASIVVDTVVDARLHIAVDTVFGDVPNPFSCIASSCELYGSMQLANPPRDTILTNTYLSQEMA